MHIRMVYIGLTGLLVAIPVESHAAQSAPVLFGLAVLVIGAKLGGLFVECFGQPSVLGELLFGILLANLSPLVGGGAGIEFVRSNETLRFLGEIGVLILLFDV